jgi:hypothetical protein
MARINTGDSVRWNKTYLRSRHELQSRSHECGLVLRIDGDYVTVHWFGTDGTDYVHKNRITIAHPGK